MSEPVVGPTPERLIMFGAPADVRDLEWTWVDEQLTAAGAYWTVTSGDGHPHPRPVWGVWTNNLLHLSIGSPTISAAVADARPVTVHLGNVTDVVILEGAGAGPCDDDAILDAYNAKYDWHYTIAEYGPLTVVRPSKVMAWRSADWAGRGGFQQTGRWRFP